MMNLRINGAWQDITSGRAFVGGTWRKITRGNLRVGDAWTDLGALVPAMAATASPGAATGTREGSGTVITNSVTITPSGGQGPFTYQWSRLSGTAAINLPTVATTNFTDIVSSDDSSTSQMQCLVTDALGSTATVPVTVSVASFSDF